MPSPPIGCRELDLLVALGVPLVLTKGHAAVEVEQTYSKALALSAHVGDTHQRFQALLGLRRFYLHRGKVRWAHELGDQLLDLARRESAVLGRVETLPLEDAQTALDRLRAGSVSGRIVLTVAPELVDADSVVSESADTHSLASDSHQQE